MDTWEGPAELFDSSCEETAFKETREIKWYGPVFLQDWTGHGDANHFRVSQEDQKRLPRHGDARVVELRVLQEHFAAKDVLGAAFVGGKPVWVRLVLGFGVWVKHYTEFAMKCVGARIQFEP